MNYNKIMTTPYRKKLFIQLLWRADFYEILKIRF